MHGIGNIVMILPAIRALRRKFPDARIDLLTLSSNKGIASAITELNSAIYLDERTIATFLASLIAKLPSLRAAGYDTAVDFEQFMEAVRMMGFYWLLLNKQPGGAD